MKYVESGFKMKAGTYTVGDVIRDVITNVKEEPKRLYMGTWVAAVDGVLTGDAFDWQFSENDLPECGTAACVGGHIGLSIKDVKVASGDEAMRLLKLPTSNYSRYTKEQRAAFDLDMIFGAVYANAETVIARLETWLTDHKDVVEKIKVKVPTREALRKQYSKRKGQR